MTFIKKIWDGTVDEFTKKHFARFGLGDYEKKGLMTIRNTAKGISIKSSFEYGNDLFAAAIKDIDHPIDVKGFIIANEDITSEFEDVKKKQKLFVATIDEEFTPEKLKEIYDKFSNHHILLNLTTPDVKLKMGKKLPKPGKELKGNFCSVTLPNEELEKFLFDYKGDFKKAEISHTYSIENIEVPKEYENDLALARLHAKRNGKITRILNIDGNEIISEKEISI
jgi:hypothetical protein